MQLANKEYSAFADKNLSDSASKPESLMITYPKSDNRTNKLMPIVLGCVIGLRFVLDIGKDCGTDLVYLLIARETGIWDSNFGSGLFYFIIAIIFGISLKEHFTNSGKVLKKSMFSGKVLKRLCILLGLALISHLSIDLLIDLNINILNIWVLQFPNAIYYTLLGSCLGLFIAQLSYLK